MEIRTTSYTPCGSKTLCFVDGMIIGLSDGTLYIWTKMFVASIHSFTILSPLNITLKHTLLAEHSTYIIVAGGEDYNPSSLEVTRVTLAELW